jgi:hypothetical protein
VIASLVLFLAIHVLGFAYWFADQRTDAWQIGLRAAVKAGKSDPRFHAGRIVRVCTHLLRQLLASVLILAYFFFGFAALPRTEIFTNALRKMIGPPLQDAVIALEDCATNLGYRLDSSEGTEVFSCLH